jgi:hypothetical protein
MKSYQHALTTNDNLVGLLKAHFFAGHEFTLVMLNNKLTHSNKTKLSLGTRERNSTGICKQGYILQSIKEKGSQDYQLLV